MKQRIKIEGKNINDLFALPCVRTITKTGDGSIKLKVKLAARTYEYAAIGDWLIEDNGQWHIEKAASSRVPLIAQNGFKTGARWADEHPKSPWISVKDRLPDTGCSVLLHFTSVIDPQLGLFNEYEGNKYWILTFGIKPFEAVDYWMPIPAIPKGVNKQNNDMT